MKFKVKASPNIALIKYWGKKDSQNDLDRNIGLNTSLSVTLSHAATEVIIEKSTHNSFTINQQVASSKDENKITAHINRVNQYFGVDYCYKINSSNNFPAGTGMASSASAFAALTISLASCIKGKKWTQNKLASNTKVLSMLSRRGSGSASRSLEGPLVQWDNEFAYKIDPEDYTIYDTILIVSEDEKKVSSSEGHKRAPLSPLFAKRQVNLPERIKKLKAALIKKDIFTWGPLIEEEAIEMHEVMESGKDPIYYRSNETLKLLKAITEFPNRDFFFTLDAGPNVHILSHRPLTAEINEILSQTKVKAEIYEDVSGHGPTIEEL